MISRPSPAGPRGVSGRPFAIGLLAVCWLSTLGCESGPGLERKVITHRLIEDDPAIYLDRTALLESQTVETWPFSRAADLEPWQQQRFNQRYELGEEGLILHSTKRRPRLVREVDWDAESIDALALDVPDFGRGISRIYWAGEGEKFSEERSVAGRVNEETVPQSVIFDVFFHPAWQGRIRQIAIELFSPLKKEFRLLEVRVLSYQQVPEAVAEAVARPWKIDLDHEARNGLLALPGTPIEYRLEIPAGAVLRIGFGTETGARQPMAFVGQLDAGDETATLFDVPIDQPLSGRWHEREVDLSPFAGQDATLRLQARASGGEHDLVHAFAFWADPQVVAKAPEPAALPNVVVISIDTLRADRLALYGYGRQTAPALDSWARRRAAVFLNTVAPSPWTIPSHVSMFAGLDPLRHGVNHPQPIPGHLPMMAELFRDAGYATMAVTGGGFMRPHRGFAQGFDRYRYWPLAKSDDELDDGIGRVLKWMDGAGDQPFLLFFHTYEVHEPYRRREPFFTEFAGETDVDGEVFIGLRNLQEGPDKGFILSKEFFWQANKRVAKRHELSDREMRELLDRYDSGIAYTDSRLARLLERLEADGLDRHTIVIVTSDHGEGLGEQGLAGHSYLYDWNLLVPLLIATPEGMGRGKQIETQVRLVDLLPTTLELAGLDTPPGLDGVSLVPLLEGGQTSHPRTAWSSVSFSNRGLALRFDNRFKYFFNHTAWAPLHGREQFYDLRRDPQELDNLAGESHDTEPLRNQVLARLQSATTALEVRFANASDRAFTCRIEGKAVHQAMTKSAVLPAGALVWQEEEVADVHVQPGDDFRRWLERSRGRLKLTGAFEGVSETFDARLVLAELEGTWQLNHGDDGWVSGPAEEQSGEFFGTGVTVHWRGDSGAPSQESGNTDAQLTEQLRALGYLP